MLPPGVTRDGSRYTIDGRTYVRVTSAASVLDKHLDKWAARLAAERAVDDPSWRESDRETAVKFIKAAAPEYTAARGSFGSGIHGIAEAIVTGEAPDDADLPTWAQTAITSITAGFDLDLSGAPDGATERLEAFLSFVEDYDPQPVATEFLCLSDAGWAGSGDLLARVGPDLAIIDWKTSASVHREHAMQLGAYANAETIIFPDGRAEPMPPIDRCLIVHLTDAGYDVYDVALDDAYECFTRAFYLYRHAQVGRLANRLPRPSRTEAA